MGLTTESLNPRPDYTETYGSRATMHDVCVQRLRTMLSQAGLDPIASSAGSLIDVTTRQPWLGRCLFEVKTMTREGIVKIEVGRWHDYPEARLRSLWFVIGCHDGTLAMMIGIEELTELPREPVKLQSGMDGYLFTLSLSQAQPWIQRVAMLTDDAVRGEFLRDPTELAETQICSTCKVRKPFAEFDLKRHDEPDGKRQPNCRACDSVIRKRNRRVKKERDAAAPEQLEL